MKKFLKILVVLIGSIYMVGCGFLYVSQEDILFRPEELHPNTTFRFGQELMIPVEDDVSLHALYHQVPNPRGVILYLHGNRGNARWCQRQAEMFTGFNHNVLLLDYRGYGKSEGEISSGAQLNRDVQVVYDLLKKSFRESQIIVAGYSIGTGMASYLAAYNDPAHLMLISPYESMFDMKDRYFPFIPDFLIKFPLNNKKHLSMTESPVTIIHGTGDEVIPYEASVNLKNAFPEKVDLVTLRGAGHRRSIFSDEIREVLSDFSTSSK